MELSERILRRCTLTELEDRNTRNTRITREFREHGGKVGGPFENATIILLHTTGAKTGKERVTPLVAQPLEGGRYAIFASHGGSPTHPDWHHNLRANPQVTYEVGRRMVRATARVVWAGKRDAVYHHQRQRPAGHVDPLPQRQGAEQARRLVLGELLEESSEELPDHPVNGGAGTGNEGSGTGSLPVVA